MEHSTGAGNLFPDRLKNLPDDVILNIFYSLGTFSDVLSFALSCRRVTELLEDYTPGIYQQVARQDIELELHARALLRDQKGLKGLVLEPKSIRLQDIRRLMRNSRRAVKSSTWFGRKIAPHTLVTSKRKSGMHPPELSLSEKSRFIKAYYYVWGLLCLQESAWPERLSHLPLRYMYYVDELSRLPQPFEGETCPYIEDLPDESRWDCHGNFQGKHVESQVAWHSYPFNSKRIRLQEELETLSTDRLDALDGISKWWDFRNYALSGRGYGGWGGFIAIYDHFEQSMIDIVLGGKKQSAMIQEVGKRRMDEEIWGDSDDEASSPYLR